MHPKVQNKPLSASELSRVNLFIVLICAGAAEFEWLMYDNGTAAGSFRSVSAAGLG